MKGKFIHFLFNLLRQLALFFVSFCLLIADPERVIIVHCNSGKGRTGTAICAFLLFCGFFGNVDDCLRFYGHRRFTCAKGVSQPCQLRYLYYTESFYRKYIISPSVKRLCKVEFTGVPNFSSGGCQPFFKVLVCHDNAIDPELKFTFPPAATYNNKKQSKIELVLQ